LEIGLRLTLTKSFCGQPIGIITANFISLGTSSSPERGVVAVTLHAYLGDDRQQIEPSWVYDYGTDPQQTETVVETVDRHILDAFTGNDRRYHGAPGEVTDQPRGRTHM
jgi:hypothetical protein